MLKKRRLRKWFILLTILPFFELQSWSQLSDYRVMPHLFGGLLSIYSILRILISSWVIVLLFHNDRSSISTTVVGVLLFVVFENLSGLMNGSIYLNYSIGSLALVGFALLCQKYIYSYRADFIWACKVLFGTMCLVGSIQIILMPYGFLDAKYKAYAVYLLGSKNSSFFYYAVYILFSCYDDIDKYNKIRKGTLSLIAIYMLAALTCESMNTFVMLSIMAVFALIINYGNALRRLLRPRYVLSVIAASAVVLLVFDIRQFLSPVLNIIGRDTTFTGRDVLWNQAIKFFRNNPLFGNGILTEYKLVDGVIQDNAHSQYLDLLAKYGLFVFVSYICIPVSALHKAVKKDKVNIKIIALKSSITFIILFHSIIDHMAMYHFILIMSSIELIHQIDMEKEERQWKQSYYGSCNMHSLAY